MDGFQISQFIVVHIDTVRKIKTRISPINDLVVAKLDKICEPFGAFGHETMNFVLQFQLLIVFEW